MAGFELEAAVQAHEAVVVMADLLQHGLLVDEGLEEERRLFYVAVTRAKNEVALVYPMLARDRYGVDVILEPSRFLSELPDGVYERWTIELDTSPEEESSPEKGETVH